VKRTTPVEVLPTKKQQKAEHRPLHRLRPVLSKKRLFAAFLLAAVADGLSLLLALTPPLQWVIDVITAVLLFLILGKQWILLPGLIAEAIPGIYMFPFWVFVVGAIAIWGTPRPGFKGTLRSGQQ
jgi:hypothetical protein